MAKILEKIFVSTVVAILARVAFHLILKYKMKDIESFVEKNLVKVKRAK